MKRRIRTPNGGPLPWGRKNDRSLCSIDCTDGRLRAEAVNRIQAHFVYTYRFGNVLDRLLAAIGEVEIELVANAFVYRARYANASRVRKTLESGCYINAVTIEIISVYDDITDIDADAKLNFPIFGYVSIVARASLAARQRHTALRPQRWEIQPEHRHRPC